MNITLNGIKITQDSKTLAFEKNNNVDEIVITVDTDEFWSYKLDVKYPDKYNTESNALYNIIDLDRNGNICSVILTREMLPFNGKYTMQLRGINGDKVYHSDTFEVWVKYSIEPGSTYNPVPSEFYQVEARLDDKVDEAKQYAENAEIASTRMPKISSDNTWLIWDAEIGDYVDTGIVASGGGGGTTDHSKLTNRGADDQHPMSAITGLVDALAKKQPTGDYLTQDDLQEATNEALAQAKASGEFDGAGMDVTGAMVGQIAKIVAVNAYGVPTAWEPVNMPDSLPSVTTKDNGKLLRVVSGVWAATTIDNANGVSF